jgi:hypothetical protein
VAYDPRLSETGEAYVWLAEVWVNKLRALRGEGESYSDVIVRLANPERLLRIDPGIL